MFLLMFLNVYELIFWDKTSITAFGNVNKMPEKDVYT